jgi:hypothetical protein
VTSECPFFRPLEIRVCASKGVTLATRPMATRRRLAFPATSHACSVQIQASKETTSDAQCVVQALTTSIRHFSSASRTALSKGSTRHPLSCAESATATASHARGRRPTAQVAIQTTP